jgi:AcrR family transcriptional regulator
MQQSQPAAEGLRERKKRLTRAAIFAAAERLFSERGFENVTVAEIADAANISVKTLFTYQRLREEAAQLRVDAREQWSGWGNWNEWSHWTERPGRAHDLGALRDFERLAREFVTDLRSVAWDSSSVLGSEVIPALRDILADTLDRIRTEVIGPMNTSAPSDPPPPKDPNPKDT